MDIVKSECIETISDKRVKIQIKARTVKEAKARLNGVKKKYPEVDLGELQSQIKSNPSYSYDPLQLELSIGGALAGRSIVKTAFSLVVESGVPFKSCEHALDYLLDENGSPCFGYYYEKDLLENRPKGIPLHCVFVKGDPITQQILGYIEYFGNQRVVLCLSSSYKGDSFNNYYAINPKTGQQLDITIDLNFTSNEIQEIYDYKKIPQGSIESAFAEIIPCGIKLSFEREKDRVINEAVRHALANCSAKEGETLSDEQRKRFTSLIIEGIMPFLIHHLPKK